MNDEKEMNSRSESQAEETSYYENKYEIVTRVAFLCGVQDRFFTAENSNFLIEVFESLCKDQKATLIRNLCLLRNAIEHNYKKINDAMYREGRLFFGLREYIPEQALLYIESRGVKLPTGSRQLNDILSELNRAIADKINNCKEIFPTWVNWEYIKSLFIMPNGTKPDGMLAAAKLFYTNMGLYPYSTYINWEPREIGNLFANDYKFVKILYELHDDRFTDTSNLSDVSECVKDRIYNFINQSYKTVLIVDCENADPYSLCAMFRSLDETQVSKIDKVILYDDPQAPSGWKFFEKYVNVDNNKIEHVLIKRILDYKSLLDVKLTARVTKEFYKEQVDSFVLVSSDSDFWGLIEELSGAQFVVMIEHKKASPELKRVLEENSIFYCYTDDFYTGMEDALKRQALFAELSSILDTKQFNAMGILDEVLISTRIDMDQAEKQRFYEKHLKNMQLHISKDGNVRIELKY